MSYQDILAEIKLLPIEERFLLLESISQLLRQELSVTTAPAELTATDIRHLPKAERNRILAEAAQAAMADYQSGSDLTQVTEALAGDDFHEYAEK